MPRITEPIKEIEVTTAEGKTERRYVAVADAPRAKGEKRRQIRRRFTRRKDAVTWIAKMRAGTAEELQESEPEPERDLETITFETVAAGWLETKRKTVRTNTYLDYEGAVTIWSEHFGAAPVGAITRLQVEQLVSEYQEAGKSVRRVSYLLMVARAVFEEAIEEDLAIRNPAKRVKPRGKAAKDRHAIGGEEYHKLEAAIAGSEYEALWLLSLAGLRRSEVLGLKWSDLDLEERTLTVRRGRVEIGGRGKELLGSDSSTEVGRPKTSNGFRTLPLPSSILEALKRLRTVQMRDLGLGQVRDGFVAVNAVGQPLRPEVYSDEWKLLLAGAGIGNYTLHEARHTSVTRAREAGVPDHAVAEWHGHDENVMRQTYSHPSQESLREVGEALFGAG